MTHLNGLPLFAMSKVEKTIPAAMPPQTSAPMSPPALRLMFFIEGSSVWILDTLGPIHLF